MLDMPLFAIYVYAVPWREALSSHCHTLIACYAAAAYATCCWRAILPRRYALIVAAIRYRPPLDDDAAMPCCLLPIAYVTYAHESYRLYRYMAADALRHAACRCARCHAASVAAMLHACRRRCYALMMPMLCYHSAIRHTPRRHGHHAAADADAAAADVTLLLDDAD